MSKIIEQINKEDWSLFEGPFGYRADLIAKALEALVNLNDSEKAESTGAQLLSAIANNHMGVYYPVVFKALGYVITVAEQLDNKISRVCALAVLNNLYYFEPNVEGYNGCSNEDLKKYVIDALEPYSDENIVY